MEYMFQDYHATQHFDDDSDNGLPDCYLRIGKYVFLFEFKDYLMPTRVITSNSFDVIKNHMDECFIQNSKGQKKGISQLFDQILVIDRGGFNFDKYEEKKIKKRNLIIIPIIVTTTYHYEMPGINSYLSEELTNKINAYSSPFTFGKIVPLTMIDFGFLYRHFYRIKKKETDLKELIFNHHQKIKESKHPYDRHKTFESNFPNEFKKKGAAQKEEGFITELFLALNIDPTRTNKN